MASDAETILDEAKVPKDFDQLWLLARTAESFLQRVSELIRQSSD
jgi:hypothetical protein